MNHFPPEATELIQKLIKVLSHAHTPSDKEWHTIRFELTFSSKKDKNGLALTQAEFKKIDDEIEIHSKKRSKKAKR